MPTWNINYADEWDDHGSTVEPLGSSRCVDEARFGRLPERLLLATLWLVTGQTRGERLPGCLAVTDDDARLLDIAELIGRN